MEKNLYSFVTHFMAYRVFFKNGKFFEQSQACPGARKFTSEILPPMVARKLVSVGADLNHPVTSRYYYNVDARVMGSKSFPEAYRVLCETYNIAA